MLGLFNQTPVHPCGTTATAPRRSGLHDSVNARGGGEHNLAKPGNVATFIGWWFGALLGAQPAEDPSGDGTDDQFPPSDCWPTEVVTGSKRIESVHERAARLLERGGMPIGAAGVAEVDAMLKAVRGQFEVHGLDNVGEPTMLSPGNGNHSTAPEFAR